MPIENMLYANTWYQYYVLGSGPMEVDNTEYDEQMGEFQTEDVESPSISFDITYKGDISEEDLHIAVCLLASGLSISYTDIADSNGGNCLDMIVKLEEIEVEVIEDVDEETEPITDDEVRRLQDTEEEEEEEEESEETLDVYTTQGIIVLANTDPSSNPGYTTDELLSMDSVALKTLLTEIYGTEYTVSAVTTPTAFIVNNPTIEVNYTSSATTNSITLSGLKVDYDGIVCWSIYQGSEQPGVSVDDVNMGMVGESQAVDHGCQSVYAVETVDETNTVTISGLQDATEYTIAHYVRSDDHRQYAETSSVMSVLTSTQAIPVPVTDDEEESQFIMIFGFLSFILLLFFY